jgi:seryl-tRNA synthetase
MFDIRLLRKNPELVKQNLRRRGDMDKLSWVDEVLVLDQKWRKTFKQINQLREKRNIITEEVSTLKKQGKDATERIDEARKDSLKIQRLETTVKKYRVKIDHLLMRLPNIMHDTVPFGEDDTGNVEIRRWGAPPKFKFKVKDHIDLALALDLVDLDRAAKVSGARFYYLKNELVQLNYALIQYAIDFIGQKGFSLYQPPYFLKREAISGAIALSDFEDVIYKIEDEDLYLIGTSEHALLALHMGEILKGNDLPSKYAAISPCFRKEAGSHGRDTKGIFRVHQFEKVEQFIFSKPQDSWQQHQQLIANAEDFFRQLHLPYRIVNVCSGDLGIMAAKKYDLEAWLPGQNMYREMVSCSNCTTYQAMRAKIRYRDKPNDPTKYVHTLNSTLVATERTLIAILENYQQEDGSICIPDVLVPYMKGISEIKL